MKFTFSLAAVVLLLAGAPVSYADYLLWDNCPGGVAGMQDPEFCMTSEDNTAVYGPTWTVDDVDLLQVDGMSEVADDLTITRLEWYGARDERFGYSYSQADVIILDENFNRLAEFSDLPYTAVDQGVTVGGYLSMYEGSVVLPWGDDGMGFTLPDHFYIGARLVGDGYNVGANRNITYSVDQGIRGRTQGYTKAPQFGAPTWEPASSVWYGAPPPEIQFEFAFRVFTNVPEPACVALLAIGSLFMARRR